MERRPIPGCPGYEVGDDGSVWSLRRGGLRRRKTHVTRGGYVNVVLRVDGKPRNCEVHRLVLLAFVGVPEDGMQACHGNGVRTDNRPDNLRWDTITANRHDRKRHGTEVLGDRNGRTKITSELLPKMREMYMGGDGISKIASAFGVDRHTVTAHVRRNGWSR